MNITLSTDSQTIERARRFAKRRNTSLNSLVRKYLKEIAGNRDRISLAEDFAKTAMKKSGHSADGFKFDRDEAHRR